MTQAHQLVLASLFHAERVAKLSRTQRLWLGDGLLSAGLAGDPPQAAIVTGQGDGVFARFARSATEVTRRDGPEGPTVIAITVRNGQRYIHLGRHRSLLEAAGLYAPDGAFLRLVVDDERLWLGRLSTYPIDSDNHRIRYAKLSEDQVLNLGCLRALGVIPSGYVVREDRSAIYLSVPALGQGSISDAIVVQVRAQKAAPYVRLAGPCRDLLWRVGLLRPTGSWVHVSYAAHEVILRPAWALERRWPERSARKPAPSRAGQGDESASEAGTR